MLKPIPLKRIWIQTKLLPFVWSLAISATGLLHSADAPSVEKLLPADTFFLLTSPDFSKAQTALKSSPLGQLWADPAMQPFRQKFEEKFRSDLLQTLEKDFGIRIADYTGLAQGQMTLAGIMDGWQGKAETSPGWIFVLDTKDQHTNLTTRLAELRKKWTDGGRTLKTEKVRDVEFTTVFVKPEDFQSKAEKAAPKPEGTKPSKPTEVILGQSGTLFLAGSSSKVVEKVLIRQAGGAVPGLNEQGAFETSNQLVLREGLVFAWLHFAPIFDVLQRMAKDQAAKTPQENPMMPSQAKILAASGLSGFTGLAASLSRGPDGSMVKVFLDTPAAKRDGLLKLAALEAKDSAIPPFVPNGVVKIRRMRLDGQKVWNGLESLVAQLSPQMSGILQMSLGALGKDKDPNFDFKKRFIANLSDDMISMERAPKSTALADVDNPPSLFLMGSPRPEQVAESLKAAAALLPGAGGESVKEREFQGRKIYSVGMPSDPAEGPKPKELLFTATANYVAMSSDAAFIEEFLRNAETAPKPLRDTPGLSDAAQKVGGTAAGVFGYDNHAELMKYVFESLKGGGSNVDKILGNSPVGPKLEVDDDLKEWFDYALLPNFERVEKYFHFSLTGGGLDARGLHLKFYYPTPPKLKASTTP